MNRASSPSAASHIRSAMSDSSSIAGSSAASQRDVAGTSQDPPPPHRRTASPSAHGIERQLHPSRRRSNVEPKGPPISLDDKANRDQAGAILIARLCARNCWPLADAERKKDLTESLLQANALATRENRPTTPQSKAMQNRVRHNSSFHCFALDLSNYCRFSLWRRPGEGLPRWRLSITWLGGR